MQSATPRPQTQRHGFLAPVAVAIPLIRTGLAMAREKDTVHIRALELLATGLLLILSVGYLATDPRRLVTWFLD